MSVHRSSADERLLLLILVPRIDLCAFALSLSSRPIITGEAAKEFTTNDSGNRDSALRAPLQKINVKQGDEKRFYTTTVCNNNRKKKLQTILSILSYTSKTCHETYKTNTSIQTLSNFKIKFHQIIKPNSQKQNLTYSISNTM